MDYANTTKSEFIVDPWVINLQLFENFQVDQVQVTASVQNGSLTTLLA